MTKKVFYEENFTKLCKEVFIAKLAYLNNLNKKSTNLLPISFVFLYLVETNKTATSNKSNEL